MTPSLTPAFILYAVVSVVSLFLTQGLIDSRVSKLVTGLASVIIPAAFAIAHAIYHGRVHAARIANSPTEPAAKLPSTSTSTAA